ncbi:MAG: hypothetical protein KDB53_17445, partial [Planctomycetes bacterium]|nr:hypothetical protein [Planctomycetota bacterium]
MRRLKPRSRSEYSMRCHLTRVLVLLLVTRILGAQTPEPAVSAAENDAERIAREIEKQVAKLRGLEFLHPTQIGVHDREELRRFLVDEMSRELPKEALLDQQRAMILLGLLPEGTQLESLILDLLSEQVAGFYDPKKKALFLIELAEGDAAGEKLQRITMSHELVHALQDQHFDLEKLLAIEDDDDRVTAVKSVIEGDATLAMLLFEAKGLPVERGLTLLPTTLDGLKPMLAMAGGGGELGLPGGDALMSTPRVIADGLIFEYMAGAKFCIAN